MAIRIFDQTVGQLAGVPITTTGKGIISNDGLEAYAQVVMYADTNGDVAGLALESTSQDILTALTTPATALPPQVPVPSSDTTFTRAEISEANLNGAATIVSATASQSTRVHGLFLTLSGASAETLVEFRSGTTVLSTVTVPATPNELVIDRRDVQYWLLKTANNETFNINTAASVDVYGDILYVKGA